MSALFPGAKGKLLPRGKLKINWINPITRGLIACYVPGCMRGIDLAAIQVGAIDLVNFGAAASYKLNAEGPTLSTAVDTLNDVAYSNQIPSGHPLITWTTLTLFIRGSFNSSSGNGTSIFSIDWDTGGSSPYVVASLQINSGGIISNTWNFGGTFKVSTANSSAQTVGVPFSAVTTFGGAGGNVIGYINNVQYNSTTFGASTYTVSAPIVDLGSINQGGGSGFDFNIAAAWNRVLTATELAYLNNNPYCFLVPEVPEWPALNLSGGTNALGSANNLITNGAAVFGTPAFVGISALGSVNGLTTNGAAVLATPAIVGQQILSGSSLTTA